jgi:nucleoside-diphosphate kinase
MGDRLAVGLRTLTPSTLVRIQVPQPYSSMQGWLYPSSVQLSRFVESDRIIRIQFLRILGIKIMAIELTLSIIKPDAVSKGHMGDILARFEKDGLRIAAAKISLLSRWQVEQIYGIHKGRPFYQDLLQFMTSGPVMLAVLEGEDAVAKNREIMGNTDPHLALPGTIRADFGTAANRNAVHGSDGPDRARYEIACLFEVGEIYSQIWLPERERHHQSVGS